MKKPLKLSGIILLGFILSVVLGLPFIIQSKIKNRQAKMTINKFAIDHIYPLLESYFPGEFGKIVFSQAAFETGNFTSKILQENNNLFGMKQAKERKTTAIGENRGHAKYDTIEQSIEDIKLYFKARKISTGINSVYTYVETISQKGYFESDKQEYINGVLLYYNLYFNE